MTACLIQHTVGAWRTVFFISACINIFGAVFYGVFGTATQQSWGKPIISDVSVNVTVTE